MTPGMDMLPFLNMTCLECQDLGPPPDSILAIPPPPLPAFLLRAPLNTSTTCAHGPSNHAEFIELPIQEDGEFWPRPERYPNTQIGAPLDDTWLLVLITSCVGVLVLGILLALFLLRLKQERGAKVSLGMDPAPSSKGCEVLYPGSVTVGDARVLWATLTPRGTTQHLTLPTKSFDNSGFVDPDDYLRIRPRVSPPTRIEHPNLPPLNLHRTFRREGSDTAPIV